MTDFSGVQKRSYDHIDELFAEGKMPLDSLGYDVDANGGNLNHIELFPNLGLILTQGQNSALAMIKGKHIVLVKDKYKPCDITPKSAEQKLALAMLKDKTIDLVTITGKAGSGKTFLALAHALSELRRGNVAKVIIAKSMVPVGREIGFLPGDLFEKVRPWLGNFYDNMETLGLTEWEIEGYISGSGKDGGKIEVSPLTYIQGRSIRNAVLIVDEAQNLSREVVHQIVTRAGENTKVILLGDTQQVFESGVSSRNNGLSWLLEQGKECEFVAHIDLPQVERSRLTEWAANLKPHE